MDLNLTKIKFRDIALITDCDLRYKEIHSYKLKQWGKDLEDLDF